MGKKKKIKKALESFEKRIEEHKQKISEYTGKNEYIRDYWGGEIEGFKKKKEKLEKKLKK